MRFLQLMAAVVLLVGSYALFERLFSKPPAQEPTSPAQQTINRPQTTREVSVPTPDKAQKQRRTKAPRFNPGKKNTRAPDPATMGLIEDIRELITEDDTAAALERLKAALEKEPNNPHLLAEMGFIHANVLVNPQQAQAFLEKALTTDPSHGQAAFELVSLYLREGKEAHAQSFLNDLAKKHPDSGTVAMARGDFLAKQGETQAAIAELERAVNDPFVRNSAMSQLAEAHQQEGNYAKAVQYYDSLIQGTELEGQAQDFYVNQIKLRKTTALIAGGNCEQAQASMDEVLENTEQLHRAFQEEINKTRQSLEARCP